MALARDASTLNPLVPLMFFGSHLESLSLEKDNLRILQVDQGNYKVEVNQS